jgi:hypothetical protein
MASTPYEAIEATVLQLPKAERIHLTEILLASLEEDDEIQAAWIAEAEQRADSLARGETQSISLHEAMNQLRSGLPH